MSDRRLSALQRRRTLSLAALANSLLAAQIATATDPAPTTSGVCDASAYGARADGKTLDTQAIQSAVNACAARGGGTVLLGNGTFLSGTLILANNITLRISPGATLLASPHIEDFRPFPAEDVPLIAIDGSTQNKGNGPYHLIHASNAAHVTIEGGGTVRGNGEAYWDRNPDSSFSARRPRPSPLMEFIGSHHIKIQDITIEDAPGWTLHPLNSDDVMIRGISIYNNDRGPNTDGIDVDSSRNVSISDTHIESGDDCIVLKTTGRTGEPVAATENIVVTNTICSSANQGFKIGTESRGDFRNITFSNATIFQAPGFFRPPTAAISLSMVDGATFENVIVSNVVIKDARTPLFLRLGNRGRGQKQPTPGTLRHVIFSNIIATGGTLASSITGIPGHPLHDITLSDIDITMQGGERKRPKTAAPKAAAIPEAEKDYPHAPMFGPLPAHGLYIRHVEGLTLRNVRFSLATPDSRPAIVVDDVSYAHEPRSSRPAPFTSPAAHPSTAP